MDCFAPFAMTVIGTAIGFCGGAPFPCRIWSVIARNMVRAFASSSPASAGLQERRRRSPKGITYITFDPKRDGSA
jgi:hypothetical protein